MADNNLQFNIGGDASEFLKAVKKVQQGLGDVKQETTDVIKATGDLGKKIVDLISSSPVFKELDKLTGGLAGQFINLSKGAVQAFKSIQVGSKLAKAALISTGVGAIVVALGLVAANWDKIKTAIVGVNFEQRQIIQSLEQQAKIQDQAVKLATSQDNTLKLQGKTQKQINNIKLKELSILLNIKKAQLSNFQESLKQAQEQQKTYTDLLRTVARALVAPFKLVLSAVEITLNKIGNAITGFAPQAGALFKVASSGLADAGNGIDRIINKITKVVAPDLTSELKQQITDTELEVVKLQNTIDGITLDNLQIDRSSNEPIFSEEDLQNITKGLTALGSISQITTKGIEGLTIFKAKVSQSAIELLALGQQLFNEVNAIASNFAESALGGVGDSIGQALAQGKNVVDALGTSLLGSLGGFLSELGGLFIKFGLASSAFAKLQLLIKSGNPIATLGGAAGLIAAGIVLKAVGGAISSKASSGGGGGGASSSSGGGAVSGGSNFTRTQSQEQTVVFKISGNNLIGVLRNASNQNARIAGANTLNIN